MLVGKPPKLTLPFNHSDSPDESRSTEATGMGSPTGHAAGAITCNDPPENADGASSTDRNGVCGGMPSSDPPRDESRTTNRTVFESTSVSSALRLSAFNSWKFMALTTTAAPTATGVPSSVAVVAAAFGSAVMVKVTEVSYLVLSATPLIAIAAVRSVALAKRTTAAQTRWRIGVMA